MLAAAMFVWASPAGAAEPKIFWASDPVRPNETALLQGSDFAPNAVVELARLDDGPATVPGAKIDIKQWTRATVLQGRDCSLKFVVPADWKMGVFTCRVIVGGVASGAIVLNAPDPWWVQGDAGQTASPGGWVRVFGKSLGFGAPAKARLLPQQGPPITMEAAESDCYAMRLSLPADFKPGLYMVQIHNTLGGDTAWRDAGCIRVQPLPVWPTQVFSVLDFYGKDALKDMRTSLIKYNPVTDRTAGIQAALAKAKANGGGIVYFPAGRYGVQGEISVPPRTVLRGEGEGLVVLWWGSGRFNLDGGSPLGYERKEGEPKTPGTLISGHDFAIEELSLYLPLEYQTAIAAGDNVRLRRVRVRIDHAWTLHTQRYEGTIMRMGANGEVSDCDIWAKGAGVIPGPFCLVARNRLMAGKTNCPLGGARQVIVEDNQFVSTHPTAYQNIAGVGRNLYYARNRHESLHVHQSDYSFTFDAGPAAYVGKIQSQGSQVSLAADPTYPKWAPEKHGVWKDSVICVMDGRGAGQVRQVTSNKGRQWSIDCPFDPAPDNTSIVTIVPFNGRVLVVANRFEDANWVNAGYGTSIQVIYAANTLYRCAQLLNYGLSTGREFQPCFYVQFFDNQMHEGCTSVDTTGANRSRDLYGGPITRCTVHRRHILAKDNFGGINVGGHTHDVIVEACTLAHPLSTIRAEGETQGVLFRNNAFAGAASPRYEGSRLSSAIVLPSVKP